MNDIVQERAYEARHIAELLEIGDSTLRKWCLALEKQGYTFVKDNKGNRLFTDHDIIALRTLKTFTHGRKMTIENGASAVVLQFTGANLAGTAIAPQREEERPNERYDELKDELLDLKGYIIKQTEVIKQQNEMIQKLAERLELQEQTMRDRQLLLLTEVKTTQERLTEATQKKWWQLWK
jgi:DNA-binding transcriptional MerR regulator